ncbi:nucleoside triphosphate pyrophosphohydrolase [Patescibacteria group bacterium]|nr:nucleoside triphosphate pyrophosphohydrolase [Patescibacteria group bacterium]MBU1721429.1 nucleoside triphosphate pyrophosphohydrolase [Patescibacteria group bacterium]MBU1901578.1 nucleoside triphosphate pyrophosphohydrolase [Patescibacteria group bacterium]
MLPKLVRDKIPQIIKDDNRTPITHIAGDDEYWVELRRKLKEEVDEFLADETEEELADVLEVLDAIYAYKAYTKAGVEKIQQEKRDKRGGFMEKIILDEIQ